KVSPSRPLTRTRPPVGPPSHVARMAPLPGPQIGKTFLRLAPVRGSGRETQRRVDHDDYDSIAGFRSGGFRGRPGASRLSVSLPNPRAVELRAVRGLLSLAERAGPARRFRRCQRVPLPGSRGQSRTGRIPRTAPREL